MWVKRQKTTAFTGWSGPEAPGRRNQSRKRVCWRDVSMAGAGSGVAMGRTGASQRERKVLFYTFQFLPPSSAVDGRLSAAL